MKRTQKYAGFWIRLLAKIVDGIILYIGLSLVYGLVIKLFLGAILRKIDPTMVIFMAVSALFNVFAFVVLIFYDIFMIKKFSWTLGKRILGLRVISAEKRKISWGQSILRELMFNIGLNVLGLGSLWIAFDKKKQGWHDKLARTYVIKTR